MNNQEYLRHPKVNVFEDMLTYRNQQHSSRDFRVIRTEEIVRIYFRFYRLLPQDGSGRKHTLFSSRKRRNNKTSVLLHKTITLQW